MTPTFSISTAPRLSGSAPRLASRSWPAPRTYSRSPARWRSSRISRRPGSFGTSANGYGRRDDPYRYERLAVPGVAGRPVRQRTASGPVARAVRRGVRRRRGEQLLLPPAGTRDVREVARPHAEPVHVRRQGQPVPHAPEAAQGRRGGGQALLGACDGPRLEAGTRSVPAAAAVSGRRSAASRLRLVAAAGDAGRVRVPRYVVAEGRGVRRARRWGIRVGPRRPAGIPGTARRDRWLVVHSVPPGHACRAGLPEEQAAAMGRADLDATRARGLGVLQQRSRRRRSSRRVVPAGPARAERATRGLKRAYPSPRRCRARSSDSSIASITLVVSSAASSEASTMSGGPKATATVVRKGRFQRRPWRGHRCCVPQIATGTMGAPAARAIRPTPVRPRCRPLSGFALTLPSGKIPATAPEPTVPTASSSARSSPVPRRIGI